MNKSNQQTQEILNIKSEDLKLLLQKRKSKIGRKSFIGITDIMSSIALIVSLVFVKFNENSHIDTALRAIFLTCAAFLLIFFTIQFVISLKPYNITSLYNEIVELTSVHSFNICVFQNNNLEGKFLLFKNVRWNCRLFPNYKSVSEDFYDKDEIRNIKESFKRDTGIDVNEVTYIGDLLSSKKSISDKIEKTYHFYFFRVSSTTYISNLKRSKPFSYNGKNFCWMTLDQMYSNRKIKKNNSDVLDFLRNKTSIS